MTDVIQRLQTAYEDFEVLSEANAFEGQNTSEVTDRTLTNKIADFGIDTGQAIVSGIEDAGVNFNQFLAEVVAAPDTLADFIGQKITDNPNFNYPGLNKETATKNIQDGLSWMDENLVPKFLRGSTKNIERKYTNQTYGNIIQGVSQFATGAIPAAKIVGLTKALPGMIAPSSAARGLTWGMIADATVIDPNAEELIAPVFRTFITNSTKDEIDTLEDTVLSILEKYDQDNDVIKRIKTANEGALIGALVEGIIAGAKALPWKTLTKALGVAGAASIAAGKKVVDTAKRVEIDDSATLSANPIPFRLKPKKTTPRDESSGHAADGVPAQFGPPAHNLNLEIEDEFTPEGYSTFSTTVGDNYEELRYFTTGNSRQPDLQKDELSFLNTLKQIKGNPEAEITMYRASPTDDLRSGDLITPSKTEAQFYVDESKVTTEDIRKADKQRRLEGDKPVDLKQEKNIKAMENLMDIFPKRKVSPSKIHTYKLKAKDVRWDGNNGLFRWGYFPQDNVTEIKKQ
jgi:hypothetical protein